MKKVNKQNSELNIAFVDSPIFDSENGLTNLYMTVQNFFITGSSTGSCFFKSAGSDWQACSINFVDEDVNSIAANARVNKLHLIFDSPTYLSSSRLNEDIEIKTTMFDRPSGSGTETNPISCSLGDVDLMPSSDIILLRPYNFEPYFTCSFYNLKSYAPVKIHYTLFCDTTESFETCVSYSSAHDTTGWYFTGSAYPSDGAVGTPTGSALQLIQFYSESLSDLPTGSYYMKVSRSFEEI